MKISVIYCCPTKNHGEQHFDYACQFVESWGRNDPGWEHNLYVVSNGGPPDSQTRALFAPLGAMFLKHDDSGWDIGAFQLASRTVQCDLMVFLGGSSYIRGPGWCRRVAESYQKHGQALYGVMGHTGDPAFGALPHIRSTGFWMPPQLLNKYPFRVTMPEQRYPFEHGNDCLTQWVLRQNLKAWVVSWDNEYCDPSKWNQIQNGYHTGDQSSMLLGDRLSSPPYYHCW